MRKRLTINRALKVIVFVVICSFSNFSAHSQLVKLSLRLERDSILIGQRTSIIIKTQTDSKVRIKSFAVRDSLNKEIEVLDSSIISTPDSGAVIYTITSFSPGRYVIPPVALIFNHDNRQDTIYSAPVVLIVLSPEIAGQEELKDIKPPMNLPFRLREILPQTGIIAGILALLLILAFFIIRRLRKKILIEKAEKALPPHIIAVDGLNKLKEEKLWQKGEIKQYYSRLSDIVRVYIENRFGITAMENVSSETLDSFKKSMPGEELLYTMLEGILSTSDMVKFAKGDPLPADNQGNMDNAYLFVEQTKIEEISSVDEKIEENSKVENS